jgi:hypothetical protein
MDFWRWSRSLSESVPLFLPPQAWHAALGDTACPWFSSHLTLFAGPDPGQNRWLACTGQTAATAVLGLFLFPPKKSMIITKPQLNMY